LQARLREAEARLAGLVADRDRILPLVEAGVETRARGDQIIADVLAAEATTEALRQEIAVARQPGRPAAREAADAATERALAARESAAYRLSQRTVTADMAGRVEEVLLEPGEYATPGQPVLAILPVDGLKIRFFVPQAELPELAIGDSVSVVADGLSAPVTAIISHIASDAEFTPPVIYSRERRDKLVFLVEADLDADDALSPGLPVEVNW
jgi:HlyD family secretion protein